MTTVLSNGSAKKPANWIPAPKQHSYEPRKIKVITIGAGFSGLMMAHKIQHEFKLEDTIEHTIYEKNVRLNLLTLHCIDSPVRPA